MVRKTTPVVIWPKRSVCSRYSQRRTYVHQTLTVAFSCEMALRIAQTQRHYGSKDVK